MNVSGRTRLSIATFIFPFLRNPVARHGDVARETHGFYITISAEGTSSKLTLPLSIGKLSIQPFHSSVGTTEGRIILAS